MAWEPAWLEGDSAAGNRPFCAICRGRHTPTCAKRLRKRHQSFELLSANVQGYIHCMPYGYTLSAPTPSPPTPSSEPFVCKLLPRQPGYVMMMCAETMDERLSRHVAAKADGNAENMTMAGYYMGICCGRIRYRREYWTMSVLAQRTSTATAMVDDET